MIRIILSALVILGAGCTRTSSEPASGTRTASESDPVSGARCQTSQVFRDSSAIWLRGDPGIGGPLESYIEAAPIGVTVSGMNLQLLVLGRGGNSSRSEVFPDGSYEGFSKLLESTVVFRVEANRKSSELPAVSLEYSAKVCEARNGSSCDRWSSLPQKLSVVFACSRGSTNPLDDPFWFLEGRQSQPDLHEL